MKIAWEPSRGERLLACTPARLAIHAADGTVVETCAVPDVVDAGWLAEDRVLALDAHGQQHVWRIGAGVEGLAERIGAVQTAAMSRDTTRTIAVSALVPVPEDVNIYAEWRVRRETLPSTVGGQVFVITDGAREWSLDPWMIGIRSDGAWSVGISPSGSHVAIGYETDPRPDGEHRVAGRGWVVLSTETWRITDRAWIPCVRAAGCTAFAFDATGARFAACAPEGAAQVGAIRVGSGEHGESRTLAGGGLAVALDDRGLRAAYAYPPRVGPQRVRVDYLVPWVRGRSLVEITDALWIDPALPDVAALAFDSAGTAIACLASTGEVDVVPVP